MSIIGTYIDRVSGRTLTGITLTTYPHSLGTTPDMVKVVLKSAVGLTSAPQPYAVGGNASLATVGLTDAPLGACSVAFFDVYSHYFHSIIR